MRAISMHVKGPRAIELLSPARDAATGIAAITHGADAVYIGPAKFGARSAAGNTTDDLKRLADFAHQYRAKVYATVNTILYDHELRQAERMITDLYNAGIDAVIVQDMAVLRLDIPPIELHASTQCDTRTPEKARFLQEAGFSQIVLAREMTLPEIYDITAAVDVPVECFIHGALCVSYSGRCHASFATCGRSANRGSCAQLCRLPYELRDARGNKLHASSHLLSLKDFNTSLLLDDLLDAGASSLKIEGRLKDTEYVKNVTAAYRHILDKIISDNPDKYTRSSTGTAEYRFDPVLSKSFNRGFTHYFLTDRQARQISSPLTPKSLGEPIENNSVLHAGDGLSFFNRGGEYEGFRVNRIDSGKIIPAKMVKIPRGTQLFRTYDYQFDRQLRQADSATRRIEIDVTLYADRVCASDTRGCRVVIPYAGTRDKARGKMDYRHIFEKTGSSIYRLRNFTQELSPDIFIPASELTALRRKLITALDDNAKCTWHRNLRRKENISFPYPQDKLSYADNVSNSLAYKFYADHCVGHIEQALECDHDYREAGAGKVVMTTRHCILRKLGLCKKTAKGSKIKEPLSIVNDKGAAFMLRFNCNRCEMQLVMPMADDVKPKRRGSRD